MQDESDTNLLKAVLPHGEVRGDTVLSVVLENGISISCVSIMQITHKEADHAVGVHALSDVELVVLEVGNNFLGEILSALLESSHSVGVGLLELRLDGLHVALKVGKVRLRSAVSASFVCAELQIPHLLVERSGLESERVDNVVDLLGTLLKGLGGLLSGRVTSYRRVSVLLMLTLQIGTYQCQHHPP